MPSFTIVAATLFFIYVSSLAYRLLTNLINAQKSGLPYLIIPWEQNHPLWAAISLPLTPWLRRNLPTWIYNRLSLTIYGHEFHERFRPFEQYAAPQGNDKSYVIVTFALFEMSTCDPEIVSEILRRPKEFMQAEINARVMGKFGPNVLITDGDIWSRHRKVVASVINEQISKSAFSESVCQTQSLLDEVVGQGEAGESSLLFDMMKKITIHVLSGAGMGAQVGWNDDERPEPGFKTTFIGSIKHIVNCIAGPIMLPQWFLFNYPSSFPGYKMFNLLGYAMKEFPIHTLKMLNEERQRIDDAYGQTKNNILSQLVQASGHGREGTKEVKALSDAELISNLFIFTGAGFDTTANTLSYALVLLSRFPQWQEWIFQEIDKIVPANSDELDYAAIYPKALRVQAVMLEVLRIFPPLIHINKMTKSPQRIETSRGSFYFPAGANLYINTVGLHTDPNVWRNLNLAENEENNGTDELAFRPSRWFNQTNEGPQLFKPPKGTYVPWSGGPRICPGQKMAQVEFAAVFIKLFQRHRIEAVRLKTDSGELETEDQFASRLDARMKDSGPILTLQMNDVYDVAESDARGLKLRLSRR